MGSQVLWFFLSSVLIMTNTINRQHWDDLYARIHDAYVECLKHNNPIYEQKLAQVLDHMIDNKRFLNIK